MATLAHDGTTEAFQQVIDKEAIRELVLAYSRAIDRFDMGLLRDCYTEDATDQHGPEFAGDVDTFIGWIESAMPGYAWTGHHVCNHMISVDGDEAEGEVYALALHVLPDPDNPGEQIEDFLAVRYIDNYRRCDDGKWRFSRRVVTFDMQVIRPFTGGGLLGGSAVDPSYEVLGQRLFQQGVRG
ncbi:MAG: nuclear transport factor 2 family protein [Novosphingobium sp.]|nr:nuclear transport factor 2 family protein [Novosphingobium sp.]